MVCKNCGGQIPENSRVCSFCETEVPGQNKGNLGELTDLEKRMAEIMLNTGSPIETQGGHSGCSGCGSGAGNAEDNPPAKPTWWKEEDCAGCGAGLTGADKDIKYALSIVGLIVGVIAFALIVKFIVGL